MSRCALERNERMRPNESRREQSRAKAALDVHTMCVVVHTTNIYAKHLIDSFSILSLLSVQKKYTFYDIYEFNNPHSPFVVHSLSLSRSAFFRVRISHSFYGSFTENLHTTTNIFFLVVLRILCCILNGETLSRTHTNTSTSYIFCGRFSKCAKTPFVRRKIRKERKIMTTTEINRFFFSFAVLACV